jgi:ATP-dependent Clp protease adaptor protein ClpS
MQTETIEQPEVDLDVLVSQNYILTLHNDDFNTFDWVIECLVKVCSHKFLQATQCAHIVHNNGKCDVKKSDYDTIKTMYEKLQSARLTVSMESE